ncbi:hypothetical protein W97_00212 [Coniosporium apollinis CBS 100218]|uniref:Heterokaryon incompatibility domain-containing protein n=1 Tax=Coniosporium apollinis (strain CBS 100218) TaxID=1168221 RepID=R7YGH7_CONA1|nr:uncharacterized protein W97_00212 [Coniosporium apollinis CBS 100218]EON61002.1 hypothetical protein W97_00212 [Coniosporium apollinis CBS 100218]
MPDFYDPLDVLFGIVLFDFSLADVRKAAGEGCYLCECILGDPQSNIEESSLLAAEVVGDVLKFGVLEARTDLASTNPDASKGKIELRAFELRSVFSFQIIAAADDNAANDVCTRPVNISPASEDSFSLARHWLETCQATHQKCPKPKGDFLPTRLIVILQKFGRRRLQLHQTSSEDTVKPYAALSYCWGGEQHVTTTKTLHRHMSVINEQDLPATVRDAVLVTETLGMNQIWIDALCIIQDDAYDKALEIASMPSVYSEATVTIAASRANGVHEGFLQNRPAMANKTPELVFQLPYRCRNGEDGSVVLLPPLPPIKNCTEPLDRRAWALQERFLSPRVLEYGSLQTRWICQQNVAVKNTVDGWKDEFVRNTKRSDRLFTTALHAVLSKTDALAPDDPSYERPVALWHSLVRTYTHRNLTLPTDRLPAISGIATQFGRILRDDYLAGLWKSRLATELLWSVDSLEELTPRPLVYQGPTWSWAAVNSPVYLPTRAGGDICIEILGCQTRKSAKYTVSDGRYGAVESGIVVLRGRLQPAEWALSNKFSRERIRRRDVGDVNGTLPAFTTFDALEEDFVMMDIDVIPIFLLKVSSRPEGLILRPKSNTEYSRVGHFEFDEAHLDLRLEETKESRSQRYKMHSDWLDSGAEQIITLV